MTIDIESFLKVDLGVLRRNIWTRAINGQYLGPVIPQPESKSLDDFLSALSQIAQRNMGQDDGKPKETAHAHIQELGLPTDRMPTIDEVKGIHRKLVFKYHPDRNPTDPEAPAKFQRAQTAYEKTVEFHERAEHALSTQQKKIVAHMEANKTTGGWVEALAQEGKSAVSFPVDHLDPEQKTWLFDTLKNHGFMIEERFSPGVGCHVVHASRSSAEVVNASEISQKLIAAAKNGSVSKPSGILSEAAKTVENAALQSGGKAEWVIGGIIAATVAIGAYIAYNKKSSTERERERQQEKPMAQGIG